MSFEEVGTFRIETTGQKGVYEFADAYDLVEEKIQKIVAIAPQSQRAFDWTTVVSPKVKKLAEDFDFATIRMGQGLDQVGGMAGKNGNFGRGMMQASFMVQDFTSAGADLERGLYSIQNNIPMLLTGLGMGGGLAGVISIVSVGVGLLATNWDSIETLWKGDSATKQAEKMKKLATATKEAADETARLKKMQGAGVDEQKATIDAALKQVGYAQALKDVQAALVKKQGSFGADVDKTLATNLLSNASQGKTASLNLLDEMFGGGGTGEGSQLGKAMTDPGDKKAMAEARAEAQRRFQTNERLAKEKKEKDAEAALMNQHAENLRNDENFRNQQAEAARRARQLNGPGGQPAQGGGGGGIAAGGGVPAGFSPVNIQGAPSLPGPAAGLDPLGGVPGPRPTMGEGGTAQQRKISRAQAKHRAKLKAAKDKREQAKAQRRVRMQALAARNRRIFGGRKTNMATVEDPLTGEPVLTDLNDQLMGNRAQRNRVPSTADFNPNLHEATAGPRRPQGADNAPVVRQMGGVVEGMGGIVDNQGMLATEISRLQSRLRQVEARAQQVNQFMQQPGPANLPGGRQ